MALKYRCKLSAVGAGPSMCRRSVDCQRGYGPMRIEMSCCMSPCGFGICVAKQKSNAYVIG